MMENCQYILNLNTDILFDIGISLLNIYPEEIHTYVYQETYICATETQKMHSGD